MKRYPPYDPPEYLNWTPDPALVRSYRDLVQGDAERRAVIEALDEAALLGLYEGLVRNRLHDLMLKRWVRQGVISKAWLGTGEEAVTIGSVHALEREHDVVAPMIRNAGACHEMGMPLEEIFRGYLGTANSPNGGRDLHFGDLARGVVQPISPVAEMVPVVTGIGLSFRRRREARVALTWVGDGSTKNGAFHEGLNLAAVLRAPVVVVLQNNQVALGTRLDQHHVGDFGVWAQGYGVAGARVDGNNILDVYAATRLAADRARSGGGPTLLLADTFRLGGHATHDEAEARTTFAAELFEYWGRRDPVGLYEEYLVAEGIARDGLEAIEDRVAAEIEAAAARAVESREGGMPRGADAEFAPFSAGVRQPGLAARM